MSKKLITESIVQHSTVLKSLDKDIIGKAAQLIVESIHNNSKIFWCGNGGSASQANHLSAELVGGMYQEKTKPCQSICLNVDTAFITAWSNDDSFDNPKLFRLIHAVLINFMNISFSLASCK